MTDELFLEIDDTFDESKVSVDALPEESEKEREVRKERLKEIIERCKK